MHPPTGLRAEGDCAKANAAVLTKLAVGRVVSAWLLVQFAELRLIKDPDAPRITKQLDHLQVQLHPGPAGRWAWR